MFPQRLPQITKYWTWLLFSQFGCKSLILFSLIFGKQHQLKPNAEMDFKLIMLSAVVFFSFNWIYIQRNFYFSNGRIPFILSSLFINITYVRGYNVHIVLMIWIKYNASYSYRINTCTWVFDEMCSITAGLEPVVLFVKMRTKRWDWKT